MGDSVRITEVHANALDESRGEFVEIVNDAAEPVSIRGLYLSDGDAWDRIVPGDNGGFVLGPGQVAVIVDPDGDLALPPGVRRLTVENRTLGDGLSTNDVVGLYGPNRQQPIDSLGQPRNPGNGYSLVRPAHPDQRLWQRGSVRGGTPGVYPEPLDPAPAPPGSPALVDVNLAAAGTLATLRGVGFTLAARIVAYRREHGLFCSVDQLIAVPGIGPATVLGWAGRAVVGPVQSCRAPHFDELGRLDVNLGDTSDFDVLPGIGPALAARIVADRESRGFFPSVFALTRVRGIGARRLAGLLEHVTVASPQAR